MKEPGYGLPSDRHILRMTDDTGMLQHARFAVPDPTRGYTADDNARALVMAAMLYEATGEERYLDLAGRYLGFLLYARSGAWFRNFMGYDRRFTEEKGSEDCFGRCIGALGYAASRPCLPAGIRDTAEFLLRQTVSGCGGLTYLRARAYAVIGLCHWKGDYPRELMTGPAFDLAVAYEHAAAPDWQWFETSLTYCNAVLPWAMLAAYEAAGEERYRQIGLESLDFLLSVTFDGEIFRPVGCKGWFPEGRTAAAFDQQPVEACDMLLACLKACRLTGRGVYRDRARRCLDWYTGRNRLGVSLIDPDTGGCMDALTPDGPNRNEGAESLVSWTLASLAWLSDSSREGEPHEDGRP